MSLRYPNFLEKMNLHKVFSIIVILFMPILVVLGILWFWQLNVEDQVENLRRLSSALIQVYAAVLALVPTISLTLLNYPSKYSTKLVRKIWKSRKMDFFFLSIATSITACFTILASLSEESSFSLKILGASFSIAEFSIVIESLTIFIFILVLYLLLDDIFETAGGHMDEILSDIMKDIRGGDDEDETLGDLYHTLDLLVENRNFSSLRKFIDSFFSSTSKDEEYYERILEILSDIYRKYEKKGEYFYVRIMKKMVDRSCSRAEKYGQT